MTLLVPSPGFQKWQESHGATRPTAGFGASVTPDTGAYGSYAAVGSALAFDCYELEVIITGNFTSGAARNTVCTIGVDAGGGTTFADRIPDLICGSAGPLAFSGTSDTFGGVRYRFNIFISAGSTIGAKARGNVTTAFSVAWIARGAPLRPEMTPTGQRVVCIGMANNIEGTSVTMGTTSEGTWTSVGSLSDRIIGIEFGVQVDDADSIWNASGSLWDVSIGDGSNKKNLILGGMVGTTITENIAKQSALSLIDESSGTLYIRGQTSANTDPMFAAVYGVVA